MRCWTLEEEQNTADRLKDDIEEEKQTLMRILYRKDDGHE